MAQKHFIPRLHYLLDISQSMNDTNNVMWPFCKFIPGRTRGEHALEICRICQKLFPNVDHQYFISFQGDLDEYSEHSLTLEQIRNKYRNHSRPRHRSNIIQRVHNVLQIMKKERDNYSHSPSHLLVFSDGNDNRSTQALKNLHRQTMNELRSDGISVSVINFGSIGLDFPNADHYNSVDFPSGNMDQQIMNMLRENISRSTRGNTISSPSSQLSLSNNQSNIDTFHDIQLSIEEMPYQHNLAYFVTS